MPEAVERLRVFQKASAAIHGSLLLAVRGAIGCNGLQPYVTWAGTLCDRGCNRM